MANWDGDMQELVQRINTCARDLERMHSRQVSNSISSSIEDTDQQNIHGCINESMESIPGEQHENSFVSDFSVTNASELNKLDQNNNVLNITIESES